MHACTNCRTRAPIQPTSFNFHYHFKQKSSILYEIYNVVYCVNSKRCKSLENNMVHVYVDISMHT